MVVTVVLTVVSAAAFGPALAVAAILASGLMTVGLVYAGVLRLAL